MPAGRVTVIIGANGCGKSTLLRGLARLLTPVSGAVLLDGRSIHDQPSKAVAQVLGLLPQGPSAPEGITVADLVGRGRYPHQGWFRRWSADDDRAVAEALEATDTLELADRPLEDMSGGQRQRVWIVMVMHYLNLACRYADHLIALREGSIVAQGSPAEIVDADLVQTVFDLRATVVADPVSGSPSVVPIGRHHCGPVST